MFARVYYVCTLSSLVVSIRHRTRRDEEKQSLLTQLSCSVHTHTGIVKTRQSRETRTNHHDLNHLHTVYAFTMSKSKTKQKWPQTEKRTNKCQTLQASRLFHNFSHFFHFGMFVMMSMHVVRLEFCSRRIYRLTYD